jgi:dihydrodipicolinate synthase/N-acetylneuraminate lyase
MVRGKERIDQVPEVFLVLAGDDITADPLLRLGGRGYISVTANIAPQQMAELCRLGLSGDQSAVDTLQATLMPLHNALFAESNPIPVKWAMHQMGLIPSGIRLPLTPLSESCQPALLAAMTALGLLI